MAGRSSGDVDPAELVLRVRQVLTRAGFPLVDEEDERTPGLRVRQVASGAKISWTASHRFAALTERGPGPGAPHDSAPVAHVQVLVQAAVRSLLTELGHTVVPASSEDGDLVVLAGPAADGGPAAGGGPAGR